MDAVVSRVLHPSNAHDDRQQADRDTGTPMRVSELVAMVDPGAEVIKVSTVEQPRGHHAAARYGAHAGHHSADHRRPRWGGSPDRVLLTLTHQSLRTQVGIERSPQLARRTAYARGMCEGIAVRAGELPLCMGRICVASAGRAYALALLAIYALGESVKLSGKTDRGRENGPTQRWRQEHTTTAEPSAICRRMTNPPLAPELYVRSSGLGAGPNVGRGATEKAGEQP